MIQLFSVELLELLDGFFNQLLTALGRGLNGEDDGAVAAAFEGALGAQVAAAVGALIGLANQLHDEGLLEGAAGLNAMLEVHEQLEAVGCKGDVADAQDMQLHGLSGFGLLILVSLKHAQEAVAVGDNLGVGDQILHRIVKHTTSAVMVICVALTAWQLSVGYEKYDLPLAADGPYLLLSDLGYEGERSTPFYSDDGSDVEHVKSLLAEFWLTREYIDLPSGKQVWMHQDLYRLRYPDMAENFAHTLMETAIFIRDPENFRSVEVPGLDAVWVGGMEIVAIKDDLAVYVVCSNEVYDNSGMIEKVLPALAEKWA